MGIIIKLSFLLFLISTLYTNFAEGGDNALTEDYIEGTDYETDNFLIQTYLDNNHDYFVCSYNNGKDPKIRRNVEEIIRVLVKDSLPPAIETPNEQKDDIDKDIQDATNKIIIQLALHASKITQKILKSMENSNDTQATIDTELNYAFIENQNRIKEVQELSDKISLLSKNTKELSDKISVNNKEQSESIEIINNKITSLENLTTSESHDIRDVLAITETIQKSLKKSYELEILNQVLVEENVTEVPKEENVTKAPKEENVTKVPKEQNKTKKPKEENVTKVPKDSLCDLKVPTSIVAKHDIWKENLIPEKDDLDIYLINKTGCSYAAVPYNENFGLSSATFDGNLLEWRMAVRAQRDADIGLTWDFWKTHGFTFFVGRKNNTVSSVREWEHWKMWDHPTPGLLSEDSYVPVYIKMYKGTLSVGHECDTKPFITTYFSPKKGQSFRRLFKTWSPRGAKYLYNCPPKFTGI